LSGIAKLGNAKILSSREKVDTTNTQVLKRRGIKTSMAATSGALYNAKTFRMQANTRLSGI
jgi:hypothetical protein